MRFVSKAEEQRATAPAKSRTTASQPVASLSNRAVGHALRHAGRPVQRCGIGSSCDCSPHERAAGIQRDLDRGASLGDPLPSAYRTRMEGLFGTDFSGVRIHTGAAANDAAAALNARAFTSGTDIVFADGAYRPHFSTGERLLAHELSHVVQQSLGLPRTPVDLGPTDPLERAADRAATLATNATGHVPPNISVRRLKAPAGSVRTISRQILDAGLPNAGSQSSTSHDVAHRSAQVSCVARLGGCANTRPGGIPTSEEIANYNASCRDETRYNGQDVSPSDEECRNPPVPAGQPGAAMICSKRLQAPVVGWFANHAYIDDTGRGDCRGSNLVGNYAVQTLISGGFVNGCAIKTDTSTDPQEYEPNGKRCDPRPGIDDVHACLRAAYAAYVNPSEYSNDPTRRPWGPNSNTFAATLAKTCCADSSDSGLGWVPGWDHTPAGPCPGAAAVVEPAEESEPAQS